MTDKPLPKNIVLVVQAARKLVRARRDLREAKASGEINERGIKKRSDVLSAAIRELDKAVGVLERELEAMAKRGAKRGGPAVPWSSIFDAVGGFADLVVKAKAGDPDTVRSATQWANTNSPGKGPSKNDDIIEAEIIE